MHLGEQSHQLPREPLLQGLWGQGGGHRLGPGGAWGYSLIWGQKAVLPLSQAVGHGRQGRLAYMLSKGWVKAVVAVGVSGDKGEQSSSAYPPSRFLEQKHPSTCTAHAGPRVPDTDSGQEKVTAPSVTVTHRPPGMERWHFPELITNDDRSLNLSLSLAAPGHGDAATVTAGSQSWYSDSRPQHPNKGAQNCATW